MRRILCLLLLPMFCSCASILSKSAYTVTFDSAPSGAEIVVHNKDGNPIYKGATPTTMTLDASHGFWQPASYQITATMPGFNQGTTTLNAGLDGWYIGNILFGGLLGILIIDPATGAMWSLNNRVVIPMGPATTPLDSNPTGKSDHRWLDLVTSAGGPE